MSPPSPTPPLPPTGGAPLSERGGNPLPERGGTEDRTAAALLIHAQALEEVRRAHEELAVRLEASGLGEKVDRLRGATESLVEGQHRLAQSLGRDRRRMLRLVGGLALLLVVSVAGLALLVLEVGGAPAPAGVPADGATVGAHSQADWDTLVAERASFAEERALLRDAMVEAERQSLVHLTEVSRLRDEIFQREGRLEELVGAVGEIGEVLARPPEPAATISRTEERTPPSLVSALQGALLSSGVDDLRVVEAGGIEDGELVDLLVMTLEQNGAPAEIFPVRRARIIVENSRVSLQLQRDQAGDPELLEIELPTVDRDAWIALGVSIARDFVPLSRVEKAFVVLLEGQSYELVSLGGWDGWSLTDVVVRESIGTNLVGSTYWAPTGRVLAEGPTLVLEQGTVEQNGVERPFWRGVVRLALPGADVATWQEAVGAP